MSKIKAFKHKLALLVLPKSVFLRGVIALVSGTAGAQALTVLASPMLTRIYSPADFGLFAVFMALTGTLTVISSLRYELVIPLPKLDSAVLNVFVLAVLINSVFGLIIGIGVISFRESISNLLGASELAQYFWILPIGLVFIGIYRSLTFLAIREKSFSVIARTKIVQVISGVIVQLVIGVFYLGPFGLIAGYVISQSAGVFVLGNRMRRRFIMLQGSITPKRVAASAKKHIRFPLYDMPAAGINAVAAYLPQIMLAAIFSPAIAGFYLLANRVIGMPIALIGQAVGQALYAHAHEKSEKGELFRFVRLIVFFLSLLIMIPLMFLFFYGEDLFSWVFGDKWRLAGVYASWLMIGVAIQFIYVPISLMLLATNAQHINLIIQMILLITKLGGIAFGYFKGDHLVAIIALSFSDMIAYFLGIVLTLRQVSKYQACIVVK